jgi:hypothetical protein
MDITQYIMNPGPSQSLTFFLVNSYLAIVDLVMRFCYYLLLLILGFPAFVKAQGRIPVKDVRPAVEREYDSLKGVYSKNKKFPKRYEKQIVYALSHYPELKDTKIQFKIRNSGAPLSSRPQWGSLLRSAKHRTNMVFIRDTSQNKWSRFFEESGVNAQVGILCHEIAHVLYFNGKTSMGLIGLGVAHLSSGYMDRFEYETDSVTLERGLGYQLLEWNLFFYKMFGVEDPYTAANPFMHNGKERYMSPATIRRKMMEIPAYAETTVE